MLSHLIRTADVPEHDEVIADAGIAALTRRPKLYA